jgi:hypothetical protein
VAPPPRPGLQGWPDGAEGDREAPDPAEGSASPSSHESRKALFQLGLRRGHLTIDEIDRALPPGALSAMERWLLLYSLRAAGVDIRAGPEDEALGGGHRTP